MNVSITLNSVDITTYVVAYSREHQICTGIGMLDLALSGNFPLDVDTWATIGLYEEGELSAYYNVSSVAVDLPNYLVNIQAQDNSKYLVDYFISESYEVGDEESTTRYWIEKFLKQAGVSYEFQSGLKTVLVSNNTAFGMMSAYEQITQLLQMSGWYMYFNPGGTCIIGKIEPDYGSPAGYFDETDILSIKTSKSDKILRNRAVVWGAADPSGKEWVFADVRKRTPWDYSSSDSRTAVVSSSNIPTVSAAYSLAYQMLDEWGDILYIKDVVLTGGRGLLLSDVVGIDTAIYTGFGVVTTVGTELSEQGFKTHIILDEKCPRIFGMWNPGAYVYAGTWGGGVKRKPLKGSTWSTYNVGLIGRNVKDLFVNDGILSCVTEPGRLFVSKEWLGNWTEIPLSGVTFEGIVGSGIVHARAVTQDKTTNYIKTLIDTGPEPNYYDDYERPDYIGGECAVLEFTPNKKFIGCYPLILPSGEFTIPGTATSPGITLLEAPESGRCIVGIDIDNDFERDYISVMVSGVIRERDNYGCYEVGGQWETGHDHRTVVHFDRTTEYNLTHRSISGEEGKLYSIYNNDAQDEALVFGLDKENHKYYIYNAELGLKSWEIDAENIESSAWYILCVRRDQEFGDTYYIHYAPNLETGEVRVDKWVIGQDSVDIILIPAPDIPRELQASFSNADTAWAGSEIFYNYYGHTSVSGVPYYLRLFWEGTAKYAGAVYTVDDQNTLVLDDVIWQVDVSDEGCYSTGDNITWIPSYVQAKSGGYRQARIISKGDNYAVYAVFSVGQYTIYYQKQVLPGLWDNWYERILDLHFVYNNQDNRESVRSEGGYAPAEYSTIVQAQITSELDNYVLVRYNYWLVSGEYVEAYQYCDGYNRHSDTPPFWEEYPHSYYFYPMRNTRGIGIVRITHDVDGNVVTWHWIDTVALELLDEIGQFEESGDEGVLYYDLLEPFPNADTDTGDVYWLVSGIGELRNSLIGVDSGSRMVTIDFGTIPGDTDSYEYLANCGRIFYYSYFEGGNDYLMIDYISGWIYSPSSWGSLALVRNNDEEGTNAYTIINLGRFPQRLDTSASYPLVITEDTIGTLHLADTMASGGMNMVYPQYRVVGTGYVGGFRYAYMASGITDSGTSTYGNSLFITVAGELCEANIDFIDDPRTINDFIPIFTGHLLSGVSTSGSLGQVETSNYLSENQYIFVCTSGEGPKFYQRDTLPFREQSTNLGEYPVTIIRLDDRF